MSDVLIAVFAASIAIAVIQSFFNHSRSSQRRIYWSCACIAAVAGFFAVYPDWKKGVGFVLCWSWAMVVIAYAYTPYIKIGGKIYALTVQDSRPDPGDTPPPETVDPEHDPLPTPIAGY